MPVQPTLIVLVGATGVGKTQLALSLAEHYHTPILSCDSRQIYRDMPIGTATPTKQELAHVTHYFVGQLSPEEYYSAARYEEEALTLLNTLFQDHNVVIMSGGSMMYIDAVCRGIDPLPTIPETIRQEVAVRYKEAGLESMLQELEVLDSVYAQQVDRRNHKRVLHAIEISLTAGVPYSTLRIGKAKQRPFHIVKIEVERPREELFDRINRRVEEMMAAGWLQEAERLYPLRRLNALNTVGYKELFAHLEGEYTLEEAIDKIKRNTRIYARKQLTWFRRDTEIVRVSTDNTAAVIALIDDRLTKHRTG